MAILLSDGWFLTHITLASILAISAETSIVAFPWFQY
ncbi:hypothetical protein B6N60_02229 [Richelia sinica FACHB-800]|uniref:Uncharacterized protein n=1 Tax=Richelia sinica FACHB-800 TaxID=1357546 RepID=A0A975T7G9_9NOST|nr:hypothetical protein B6N60_02229 [Richelia sinica FACHB-800]